jgi:hypothetical protein
MRLKCEKRRDSWCSNIRCKGLIPRRLGFIPRGLGFHIAPHPSRCSHYLFVRPLSYADLYAHVIAVMAELLSFLASSSLLAGSSRKQPDPPAAPVTSTFSFSWSIPNFKRFQSVWKESSDDSDGRAESKKFDFGGVTWRAEFKFQTVGDKKDNPDYAIYLTRFNKWNPSVCQFNYAVFVGPKTRRRCLMKTRLFEFQASNGDTDNWGGGGFDVARAYSELNEDGSYDITLIVQRADQASKLSAELTSVETHDLRILCGPTAKADIKEPKVDTKTDTKTPPKTTTTVDIDEIGVNKFVMAMQSPVTKRLFYGAAQSVERSTGEWNLRPVPACAVMAMVRHAYDFSEEACLETIRTAGDALELFDLSMRQDIPSLAVMSAKSFAAKLISVPKKETASAVPIATEAFKLAKKHKEANTADSVAETQLLTKPPLPTSLEAKSAVEAPSGLGDDKQYLPATIIGENPSTQQFKVRFIATGSTALFDCTQLRPANWSFDEALKLTPPVPKERRLVDAAKTVADAARQFLAQNMEALLQAL